jgi:hypothetical protein
MFGYDPIATLARVQASIRALLAADETGSRAAALAEASAARERAGRSAIAVSSFPGVGHNLMRYRPDDVTAAILGLATGAGR